MRSAGQAPRRGAPRAVRWLLGLLALVISLLALAGPAAATVSAGPASPAQAAQPEDAPLPVSGTLRDQDGTALSGVTVEVLDAQQRQVTEAVSDQTGRWETTVPVEGRYTFRVDERTLPEGTAVIQSEVTRQVAEGRLSTVIFRFGEERAALDDTEIEKWIRLTVDGIRFGLVIGIAALGLSLIFGTTGLTNFAHGELVTIGAVVAWAINTKLDIQLVFATILAMGIGALIGAANEFGIWRPMRRMRAGLIAALVVSIGLALALRNFILILFGGPSRSFEDYNSQVVREYGPIELTDKDLATIIISIVVMIGVGLLLQKTRIGTAIRAVRDNRDLAASSGINVDRVILVVWMLGGSLATLGGVLFALSELSSTVQFEMGFRLLLLMFAGVILGGIGTAYGALVGCLIVGVIVQWSTEILPVDLKYVAGLTALIVILVLRPQGLFGSRARIG